MRVVIVMLAIVCAGTVFAQGNSGTITVRKKTDSVSAVSATNSVSRRFPQYKGGDMAFSEFIDENLKMPDGFKDKRINGSVSVAFYLLADGSITDVTVSKAMDNCLPCNQEAIRLVKSMTDWLPANAGGKNINMNWSVEVPFRYVSKK